MSADVTVLFAFAWPLPSPAGAMAGFPPKGRVHFQLLWGQAVRNRILHQFLASSTHFTGKASALPPAGAEA